jgi:hypothetical protein
MLTPGQLDKAKEFDGCSMVISKEAFKAGSSKQGLDNYSLVY